MKSHKMPDDKIVKFWSWITPNTIGLITDTEVFHWSIDGTWVLVWCCHGGCVRRAPASDVAVCGPPW